MRPSMPALALAALSVASLLALPAAYAQNQASQPQNGVQAPSPSPTISDRKLNAAAVAMERVTSLEHSYQQQIASAPPTEKPRVAREANDAFRKAVTDQGLSVEEYNSILQVAQNDPTVRNKLFQRFHPPSQ